MIEPGENRLDKAVENLKSIGDLLGIGKKPAKDMDNVVTKKSYLSDYLNYEKYLEDSGIFENKSTYGFVLKLRPFSGIDSKTINALKKIISYEIPHDAIVQVINYASPNIEPLLDKWCNTVKSDSNIYKELSEKRKKFFLSGCSKGLWGSDSGVVLRNFELYFCVSFRKESSKRSNDKLLERIDGIKSKLSRAFSGMGCTVKKIAKKGLNDYLSEILLPKEDNLIGGTVQGDSLIEFPSNPEYIMHKNFAEVRSKVGSKKFVIFEVSEWAIEWDIMDSINYVGDFRSGRGIGFPFYISFGFKSDDLRESERKATKARVIKTNQTTGKLVNFVPAMREELEDWHYITDEIDKGARLAKACMYIVAVIDEEVDAANAAQDIRDYFYQLGFGLNQIKYDCLNSVLNTLPMQLAENWSFLLKNKSLTTMMTSNCLDLLPVFADVQSSSTPLMMFVAPRGQPFFFDNFASKTGNGNTMFVGKPGSGKSFGLQYYATSVLRQGGQAVVLDDGRSFQNSTAILDGTLIDFKDGDFCINPFSLFLSKEEHNIKEYKTDFEEPLVELIVSTLCVVANVDNKNDAQSFTAGLYKSVLKTAALIVLEEKGKEGGLKDVYTALKNNPKVRTPQTEDIADKLAYVIEPYALGRYASHFNGKAMFSLDNPLTVFEFSSLQSNETLQTSVLMVVVFLVYTKMQSRERRMHLIIDEAWRLICHAAMKDFMEGIARRARKYLGSLDTATQNVSDYAKERSVSAAAVLAQTEWKVIFSAQKSDEKVLKEQLGMSEAEINIACNLSGEKGRYSEFMLRSSEGEWCIGRLILDEFSVKLYSSTPADVVRIQELKDQGYSVEAAINQLIQEERNVA